MQCNTDHEVRCLVVKNEKGSISGCQNCKDEQQQCTVLWENPAIRQGQTILHPSGSWDHLAVKLKAKIKLLEVVPYNTDNEAQGSPLVPAVGKGEGRGKGKGKGKMLVTQVLPCQIEGGYLVYDPKMPNGKIGSIRVRPRQLGEENSIFPVVLPVS